MNRAHILARHVSASIGAEVRGVRTAGGVSLSIPKHSLFIRNGQRISVKNIVAAFTLALSACQTPATRTVTQEVRVPVAVQPLKPEQVPTPPAPLPPRPSSLSAAADVLLSQVCDLEAYVLRADPLLRVSAGLPPRELPRYPECER